jgi:hypothetical protein
MTEQDIANSRLHRRIIRSFKQIDGCGESYPNLKADQQYINFQREYTAIENSIRTETVYYKCSKDYNVSIKQFPNNILANFTNFKEKPFSKLKQEQKRHLKYSQNNGKQFLTNQQIASLVEAIQSAEEHSTGEIRVHIDSNTDEDMQKLHLKFSKNCV